MATRKAAASATAEPEPTRKKGPTVLGPQKAHELLGLPGPYGPPPQPPAFPGYLTYWDCGISIRELIRKKPGAFDRHATPWVNDHPLAKASDSWRWRQLKLRAADPGKTFDEQAKMLSRDDEIPLTRELVAYLVVHFLATGERLEIPRLRCRDVMPAGRRVVVGPFRDTGLEIGNVSDRWSAPGIGLASIFTPAVPRKKR